VAVSADGSRVVTGGWDGTARVWDARPLDAAFRPRRTEK
jgi:WD40 repeat protein